ncbi:MAG: glycerophosphodiester phosphodiesterase [Pseudomonadota bacterium]
MFTLTGPAMACTQPARRLGRRILAGAAFAVLAAGPAGAFDLQGHRGARGLAPENTLAAFDRALDIGVTTLELDIAITADGIPVVSHDATLNPAFTRDRSGRWLQGPRPAIHALPFAALQAWDVGRLDPASPYAAGFPRQQAHDGERIPSLAALFGHVKARGALAVRFNIEAKTDPYHADETPPPEVFARLLVATIRAAGMAGRVTVQGFDWRALDAVQRLAPELPTAYLTTGRTVQDPAWTRGLRLADFPSVPAMVTAAGGRIWSPSFNGLSQEAVEDAHRRGLQVLPWTVNQPADMARLLDWGVDGLITDYPDVAAQVLQARGIAFSATGKR